MNKGLKWICLTVEQKDYGEWEVSNYWIIWILDVWGKQEYCYNKNGIGSKRRRTRSFGRREDGFPCIDLVNKGTFDLRKTRIDRGYTSLLGKVMVIMQRKSSLNMT